MGWASILDGRAESALIRYWHVYNKYKNDVRKCSLLSLLRIYLALKYTVIGGYRLSEQLNEPLV